MDGRHHHRPLAAFKRPSTVTLHPELTNRNIENLREIHESEYEDIPVGDTAINSTLPRNFRYYYDYAGRKLGYMLDALRINFFNTSFEKIDVFVPNDVYVCTHIYDISGKIFRGRPPLRFNSNELFGPRLSNLTIFKNIIQQSSDTYRRVVDDIDPQLAFLMWMDFTPRQEWHALFTRAFKGRYSPPDIVLSDPKLYAIYVMAYFLLSHAVYNSDMPCSDIEGNFYHAPKNKKRLCFTEYRKEHPQFFDEPYIHEKLVWAAGSEFNEPAINTAMYDLLINPFRNSKGGGV